MNIMTDSQIASRMATLSESKKLIEKELEQLKAEAISRNPCLLQGVSTANFKATIRRTLELDQPKAFDFLWEHQDYESFFKLSLSIKDAERMGGVEAFTTVNETVIVQAITPKAYRTAA